MKPDEIERELARACHAFAAAAERGDFELAEKWLDVAFVLDDLACGRVPDVRRWTGSDE